MPSSFGTKWQSLRATSPHHQRLLRFLHEHLHEVSPQPEHADRTERSSDYTLSSPYAAHNFSSRGRDSSRLIFNCLQATISIPSYTHLSFDFWVFTVPIYYVPRRRSSSHMRALICILVLLLLARWKDIQSGWLWMGTWWVDRLPTVGLGSFQGLVASPPWIWKDCDMYWYDENWYDEGKT